MKLKLGNEVFTESEIEQLKDQLHTTDIRIDSTGLIAKYAVKPGSNHFMKLSLSLKSKKLLISSFTGKKPKELLNKIEQALKLDLNMLFKMQIIVPVEHIKCSVCGTWHPPLKIVKNADNELVCDVCSKVKS